MSVAGLQEGVAQDLHVGCAGGATFYGHFFACDAHHGSVDIHNAIPYSCDTFFYTLANKLGIDTIAHYAQLLGLAQKTGIDLPDEVTGTMPSTAWKLQNPARKVVRGRDDLGRHRPGRDRRHAHPARPRARRHRLRRRAAPAARRPARPGARRG